jgi:hypothetical protein
MFFVIKFNMVLSLASMLPLSLSLVPLPQSNIIHPTSGLALRYVSQYSPADHIVPLTVSIPLTLDMCYLLPLHALQKIPGCHNNTTRQKRFLTEIITIGISSAALTMSTTNMIQNIQMKQDINSITQSLTTLDSLTTSQTAELYHLQAGQLKLATTLNHTQIALNRTINLLNYHSINLDQLMVFAKYLDKRLTTFIHSVESHFLHTSLSHIFANQLNLHFIHHRDLNEVVNYIISATNVDFNNDTTGPPLVDLVSQLLVQQVVQFLPRTQSNKTTDSVIGILSISSFFAATKRRHTPFSVYQLLPVPFSHANERVRLANLPSTIGIDFHNAQLIKWSTNELSTCDLRAMTVCRETPPVITNWNDTCLYQILTNSILSNCRTELFNDPVFIHQLGPQWIISTTTAQQCHLSVFSSTDPPHIIQDTVRTLPAVTLLTIAPKTTLICERFSIQPPPEISGPPITIWDFSILNHSYGEAFNLDPYLTNFSRWPKIPYISNEFRSVFNFITNTSTTRPTPTLRDLHRHPFGIMVITTTSLIVLLLIILGYCYFACRPQLPSIYLPVKHSIESPLAT